MIEIIEREERSTLEIKADCSMLQFGKVIGQSYAKITEYMQSENIECTDAPFVRYLDLDWADLNNQGPLKMLVQVFTKKWNVLIGFPIREKIDGSGKILSGTLKACRCVQTIHKGPYPQVGKTYKKMQAWIEENNINVEAESVETYLNDPRETNKEDLETIVQIPISE